MTSEQLNKLVTPGHVKVKAPINVVLRALAIIVEETATHFPDDDWYTINDDWDLNIASDTTTDTHIYHANLYPVVNGSPFCSYQDDVFYIEVETAEGDKPPTEDEAVLVEWSIWKPKNDEPYGETYPLIGSFKEAV